MKQFYQEYLNSDSGEVERITAEPLHFWTAFGWEIVPSGFKFYIPSKMLKWLDDDEIKSLILYQWHRIAKNKPQRAIIGVLRDNLINYPSKIKAPSKGRLRRYFAKRAKAEVIIFIFRLVLKVTRLTLKVS
jgi:hypothetical protein